MNSDKRIFRRKPARLLVTLLLAGASLVAVDRGAIYARSTAEPGSSTGWVEPVSSLKTGAPSSSVPILDSTPAAKSYLPLVYGARPAPVVAGCNPTGGSRGSSPGYYHTTVAGLDAAVVVGKGYNPHKPTYLAFFLHGDNGDYLKFLSASNPATKFIDQHGWIFVSPQSPNGGEAWWTHMNGDHSAAFAQVLDEMFAKYNVCRNIVFGSSGSGGSEFWTSRFFPDKGDKYPAHVVIGCGGDIGYNSAARQRIVALGKNPDIVARSSFDFVYGTEDYLYDYTVASIKAYTAAGFHVYDGVIQGAGHCNEWDGQGFPVLSEQMAAHWATLAARLGVK